MSADTSLTRLDPKTLKPHPRNRKIYGEDEDISQLVEAIRTSGWLRPLLVTPKRTIISGRRRWRAALELGLDWVPVEVREFPHRMAELETLLVENSSRPKTREQKVREAHSWKEIEADKAKRRQAAGVHLDETDLLKIFSEGSRGNTRDIVAAKAELGSGTTYAKAAKVVAQIDRAVKRGDEETAAAWRQVLNSQSVQAAYELLKLPAAIRQGMLDLIATGAAQTTKEARQLLAESKAKSQLDRWQVGDWARVSIDVAMAISPKDIYWNGCWGRVEQVETRGVVVIDLGAECLRLYPSDLQPLAPLTPQLLEVAPLVLQLRRQPLDEIESAMLDVLQRQSEFSDRQLAYLELMENLCPDL